MLMNALTEVITAIAMPHALIQRVALHVLAIQVTVAMELFVKVLRIHFFFYRQQGFATYATF